MGSKQLNDTEQQVIRTVKGREFYKYEELPVMIASKTLSKFNVKGSMTQIF